MISSPHSKYLTNILLDSDYSDFVRAIDSFFNDFGFSDISNIVKKDMYPVSDVYISEDGTLKIEMAVTGRKKEDISIFVENGVLVIEGKELSMKKDEMKKWRRIEGRMRLSSFKKTIRLSNKSDCNKAEATVEDGLLTIIIPLKEPDEKKTKMISIK
jgi:HSP20 family molecular chaperone IbpA